MKNGQSRETERQTTQNQLEGLCCLSFCLSRLSILHYPFSNWFCVVCRSVSLDCPFFITPSLTGFVLFVVLKNGQSRETERQTTQNQLEKG
jgi:hypothetical protein